MLLKSFYHSGSEEPVTRQEEEVTDNHKIMYWHEFGRNHSTLIMTDETRKIKRFLTDLKKGL